jgi:drug/metabolite transporter (DMT)-like permease
MNFLLAIPAYIWLVISAIFFGFGEYLSKRWGMQPTLGFAVITVCTYAIGTFAWLPALLHKNQLAIMGTAWLLLAMVATIGIGFFVFHEHLNGYQIAGVILAFAALVLLSL